MVGIAENIKRGLPWIALPLLTATGLRLLLEPQYWTFSFACWLLLIPLYVALQRLVLRKPGAARIRVALLVNFAAINVGYTMIGVALRSAKGWRADSFVYGIDKWVFGRDPQLLLTPIRTPWLSTVAMFGYLVFALFLFYLFLSEAFVLSPATGQLQLGLMRLYGLGFSGYIILPAEGPAFDHPGLLPAIAHSALTARLQPWVLGNCSRVDVCPSIHAAITCFLLIWTYRRNPTLFTFLVLPSAALLLGTVYFQYHYFTDLPFGLLLGAFAAIPVSHDLPHTVRRSAGPAG